MVNKLSVCLHRVSPRLDPTRCQCRSPSWAEVRAWVGSRHGRTRIGEVEGLRPGVARPGVGLSQRFESERILGRRHDSDVLPARPQAARGRHARSLGSRRQSEPVRAGSATWGTHVFTCETGVLTVGVLTHMAREPWGTDSLGTDADSQ